MLREAKSTARILKEIYNLIKKDRYYLSKETFKAIAGRGNLRNVYLTDVNMQLHRRGLTLIDLRKIRDKQDCVGVIETKKILSNWKFLSKTGIKNLNIPALKNSL
jgi:hypothetical protein